MIKDILIKEIREQALTTKMFITFAIIILLSMINGFVFTMNYDQRFDKYLEIKNKNRESIRESSKSLLDLVFMDQKLIKPPSKVAFIAEAEEKVLPNGMELNYFSETNPKYYKRQNMFFSTFSSMDWTYILLFFISFVCISFSYNAFSGEKVNGTLKLTLSNTIARWQVILGKYLGILAVILFLLLVGILINLVIVQFNPNLALNLNDYLLILLFLIGAALFVSLNILMGFLISCLTPKPTLSLSIVLIFWIIFSIVVPNISWLFAKKMVPISSISKLRVIEKQRKHDVDHSGKYSLTWHSDWKGKPPNELVLKRAAGSNKKIEVHNDIWQGYLNKIIMQTKVAINLSKISPFLVFRFLGETISDNGFHGYVNFYNQIRYYQSNYHNFLKSKDQADKDSYHIIWNEYWNTSSFMSPKPVPFDGIPQFVYTRPTFGKTLDDCKWDFLILMLWNLLLFSGTFVAFIRYDVR